MIFALILALVVLTGWAFCHAHDGIKQKLRWHSNRGGLYQLYSFHGAWLFVAGYMAYRLFYEFYPNLVVGWADWVATPFEAYPDRTLNLAYAIVGSAGLGGILAVVLGKLSYLANVLIWSRHRYPVKELLKEVKKTRDNFTHTLLMAFANRELVMITLDSEKTYIGYPARYHSPYSALPWLAIIPVASGYRQAATKELRLTTDYFKTILPDVLEGLNRQDRSQSQLKMTLSDYAVQLRTEKINSLTLFDLEKHLQAIHHTAMADPVHNRQYRQEFVRHFNYIQPSSRTQDRLRKTVLSRTARLLNVVSLLFLTILVVSLIGWFF